MGCRVPNKGIQYRRGAAVSSTAVTSPGTRSRESTGGEVVQCSVAVLGTAIRRRHVRMIFPVL